MVSTLTHKGASETLLALELGAARVVVGTRALEDADWLEEIGAYAAQDLRETADQNDTPFALPELHGSYLGEPTAYGSPFLEGDARVGLLRPGHRVVRDEVADLAGAGVAGQRRLRTAEVVPAEVRGVRQVVPAVTLEHLGRLEGHRGVHDLRGALGRDHVVAEPDRPEVLRVVEALGRRHAR